MPPAGPFTETIPPLTASGTEWWNDGIIPAFKTIHKAAGSLVTGHSQNATGRNAPQRPFLLLALIHSLQDISQWNGGTMELYQLNQGMARKREAGGFVNSVVCE